MKTIVAGSRSIECYDLVKHILAPYKDIITEEVCGLASGIDYLGKKWANANEIPVKDFPALWEYEGKAAGPIRNKKMGDYADQAVIIWDGVSKGSLHMSKVMDNLEKPCRVYKVNINYERSLGTIIKVYKLEDGTEFREHPTDNIVYR